MERKLNDLPQQPKKGKIYEMYGRQYSVETMKNNLKILIDHYIEITKKVIEGEEKRIKVGVRDVPRPVWIEWLKTFGFPANYEPQPELLETKTVFDNQ